MAVKILVADDSATMRKIMEMTFAGEGAEVVCVDSGDAAVQKAQELGADLVFADVSMGTDGYAVSTALKTNPATAKTAVVILSSQHNPYDEAKGKAAGVDDHIVKPFDTQAVIDKVAQVLSQPRAQATAAAPAAAAAPPAPPRPAAPARPSPPAPSRPASGAAPPPPPRPAAASGAGPRQSSMPSRPGQRTVAFGQSPAAKPAAKPAAPPKPPQAEEPELTVEIDMNDEDEAPAKPAAAAAAATSSGGAMAAKLEGLGLTAEQVEGVLALSREVIEQVVWEVVPDLAEVLIKEEIARLTAE